MSDEKRRYVAVLRLRGSVGIDKEREYVFKLLCLTRKNHAILIENRPSNLGSLRKIKDFATWGEVTADTISLLLEKRGMLEGRMKLTDRPSFSTTYQAYGKITTYAYHHNENTVLDIAKKYGYNMMKVDDTVIFSK